jgi:hypothetical protein
MKFLEGYKTYIIGIIMILTGAAELIGFDVAPNVDPMSAWQYIMNGLAFMSLRAAVKPSA